MAPSHGLHLGKATPSNIGAISRLSLQAKSTSKRCYAETPNLSNVRSRGSSSTYQPQDHRRRVHHMRGLLHRRRRRLRRRDVEPRAGVGSVGSGHVVAGRGTDAVPRGRLFEARRRALILITVAAVVVWWQKSMVVWIGLLELRWVRKRRRGREQGGGRRGERSHGGHGRNLGGGDRIMVGVTVTMTEWTCCLLGLITCNKIWIVLMN